MSALTTNEAACVYAAVILQDEGLEITADKIAALVEAASVEVESIWPTLFAKALAGKDLGALLFNVGSGGGAAAPAAAGGAAAAPAAAGGKPGKAAAVEEVKEEKKEESDDDMGFGLFD